jgi:micrococcal nuclease
VFVGLRDVGLEQGRAGMAWWYAHEQTTQERLVNRDEEEAAKAARRGLWKEPNPVPP